jgi:signal transduction histidine kinase
LAGKTNIVDKEYLESLKDLYFSSNEHKITLKKGDVLFGEDVQNQRLYFVCSGLLVGYKTTESGLKQEIFRSQKNMFAGVHSFFSKSYTSYAEIVALRETVLAYIDADDFSPEEHLALAQKFVPIIVNELSSRQTLSQEVMVEKEKAQKKLFEAEKMATLGQMAAGLTHELNNAIGVLKGNTDWLIERIESYLSTKEDPIIITFFKNAYQNGQTLTTQEIRENRQLLEKRIKASAATIKKVAKMGIDSETLRKIYGKKLDSSIDNLYNFWEIAIALHDIKISSRQAEHVLKSVKQLAVTHQDRKSVDISESIEESLILLKTYTRQITILRNFENGLSIHGNFGELVQIWINILKNACEILIHAKVEEACLSIETRSTNGRIEIIISDNGPGISDEMQAKIFQPNFTTKKDGLSFGLGLGLSIVQRLVESYNGKINLSSRPGYTSFNISLPK